MKPLVFLCQPRYSNLVDARALEAFSNPSSGAVNFSWGTQAGGSPAAMQCSLLAFGFNKLWCMALNLRSVYRITHFAMLHADVQPEPGWLDKLIAEQKRVGADVLSCVIPFKTRIGLTSTGLGIPDAPREQAGITGDSRRLTMNEVHQLPSTFGAADTDEPGKVLLINTGCWVADFTKPWADKVCFRIHDDIVRDTEGRFHAETKGEDWNLSYQLHDLGCRVFATRAIQCIHHGDWGYSNWPAWGDWQTDEAYKKLVEVRKEKAAQP